MPSLSNGGGATTLTFVQPTASLAMSIAVETFPVMPTRPCRFCFSLQGGSVFADFDTDDQDLISLRRISFDGFGCCRIETPITKMSSEDSRLLLDAIAQGDVGSEPVQDALRRYFRANSAVIWDDALTEHELL
jgi:hypothetical protein